jgi:hypothetical protein
MRISIGCAQLSCRPGTASASAAEKAAISPSRSSAVRHSERGFSMMKVSLCSTPIGSVGISELPPSVTAVFTSGNFRRVCSIMVCVFTALDRPMLGSLVVVTVKAPSSRRGMNSAPSLEATMPLPRRRSTASPSVHAGCRIERINIGA